MSGPVHGRFSEPTETQESMVLRDQASNSEDSSTSTIQMLALESLNMGVEEMRPEGDIHASLDIEEMELTEDIENVRSELFGEVDSEMEDLAAMLGLDMDEVDDIMNNDDLAGMLGLDEDDLEEFEEMVFEGEMAEIENYSDEEVKEQRAVIKPTVAIFRDRVTNKFHIRPLDDEYVMHHPYLIEATFDKEAFTGKEDIDFHEFLALLENDEVEIHEAINPEILESLMAGDFEIITLKQEEWNSHVSTLYMNLLGIKIDDLAQKTFDRSQSGEEEVPAVREIDAREVSIPAEVDRPTPVLPVVIPILIQNGIISTLLEDIQASLNEINQIKKNEEKQQIQREVLVCFLRLKRLQFESMQKNEKKEKIWFENTTSFLRFLLRRDLKILLRQKQDPMSQAA